MNKYIREVVTFLLIVVVIFVPLRLSIQNFTIDGPSMEPSFKNKEIVLVDKVLYHLRSPQRGDVIIFRTPPMVGYDATFIKRIIGLPGDTLTRQGNKVYITTVGGEVFEDPYPTSTWGSAQEPYEVAEGEYFVMGDNRSHSSDSRSWGTVPKDRIVGKVSLIFWPLGDLGLTPGYETTAVQGI